MFEEIQDTDCAFVLDLLQHAVNDNVCSCASNPCTTEQSTRQYEHNGRPVEGAVNQVSTRESLELIRKTHLAQVIMNHTCSAPGQGPCQQCEQLMSGWWRWAQGGCTPVLPCQATECSDTGSQCARLASLLDSPSDPKTFQQTNYKTVW